MVERRKHTRIRLKNGAFVGVGPNFDQVGPLIDISTGGLAFRYMALKKQPSGLSLDIFSTNRNFYLSYIPFKTVSDCETVEKAPSSSITMRRCSLEFSKLTRNQKSRLEQFIRDHTIREA